MKKLTIFTGMLFLTVLLNANLYAQYNVDWLLQSKTNGVELYYKVINCNDQEVVILKFINANNFDVKVLWDNELLFESNFHYRSNLENGSEAQNSIVIKAGEIINAQCNELTNPQLIIHYKNKVSFPPYVKVIKFRPYNFSVNK
ncbi:MAG: hypothetical protein FVQ77_03685 [Cytophagales bacterium]|nr:hypothetical protein [Cytophagales bacterium]